MLNTGIHSLIQCKSIYHVQVTTYARNRWVFFLKKDNLFPEELTDSTIYSLYLSSVYINLPLFYQFSIHLLELASALKATYLHTELSTNADISSYRSQPLHRSHSPSSSTKLLLPCQHPMPTLPQLLLLHIPNKP